MPTSPASRQRLEREVERLRSNALARSRDRHFSVRARWNEHLDRVDYLYREHELLCLERDIDQVQELFTAIGEPAPASVRSGPLGIAILEIGDRDAADLAQRLSAHAGGDEMVTVNHVLDAQSGGYNAMCPATEALPWYGPVPTLGGPVGAGKARIAVVDTGFSPEIASASGFERFSAVNYDFEEDDEVYYPDSTTIRPYGGHGTAATAALLAVSGAGSVTVKVTDCLVGGAVDEITIVEALERSEERRVGR